MITSKIMIKYNNLNYFTNISIQICIKSINLHRKILRHLQLKKLLLSVMFYKISIFKICHIKKKRKNRNDIFRRV